LEQDEGDMADGDRMQPQLQATYDRLMADKQRQENAKVYQFPIWPEPDRGIPNEFSRSALFAAIQAKGRSYFDNQQIASQEGYTITYTGQRLDQTHLDVFEGIMHIARGIHEGNKIRFSANGLLKLIGRDIGNAQHKWLLRTLNHLTATSVQIKKENEKVFWGSLLPKGCGRPNSGGEYEVEITRELILLFDRGFTQVDWEQRRKVRRKPLAQWLQLYFSSHAKPHPVTISFLHEKTGSTTKSLRKFKPLLKAALSELEEIGAIVKWSIDDTDKVSVIRIPSPSQQRYLSRVGA
jgi:hypothetical protein